MAFLRRSKSRIRQRRGGTKCRRTKCRRTKCRRTRKRPGRKRPSRMSGGARGKIGAGFFGSSTPEPVAAEPVAAEPAAVKFTPDLNTDAGLKQGASHLVRQQQKAVARGLGDEPFIVKLRDDGLDAPAVDDLDAAETAAQQHLAQHSTAPAARGLRVARERERVAALRARQQAAKDASRAAEAEAKTGHRIRSVAADASQARRSNFSPEEVRGYTACIARGIDVQECRQRWPVTDAIAASVAADASQARRAAQANLQSRFPTASDDEVSRALDEVAKAHATDGVKLKLAATELKKRGHHEYDLPTAADELAERQAAARVRAAFESSATSEGANRENEDVVVARLVKLQKIAEFASSQGYIGLGREREAERRQLLDWINLPTGVFASFGSLSPAQEALLLRQKEAVRAGALGRQAIARLDVLLSRGHAHLPAGGGRKSRKSRRRKLRF